jgi:His Kinase A (phospho-acceptor) domain
VRFDDRIETILAQSAEDGSAKAVLWSQLVDIISQENGGNVVPQRSVAIARLAEWRNDIPLERRRAVGAAIAGHAVPLEIIGLFGSDAPAVAAPVLAAARLSAEQWQALIPTLPQASRALLRERRDLPQQAQQALSAYGSSDFSIEGQPAPSGSTAAPIQISDLVARIEAFQRDRTTRQSAKQAASLPDLAQDFRFETDSQGLLCWVEGAPRGPLIGTSLADMADPGAAGVDGHAAGAFRQRELFRDARLVAPGVGESSGEWLISADPLFSAAEGRFLGYRGVGRRPRRSENLNAGEGALLGHGLTPDSVRQLIHELRTPLNAIRGFGEMIDGQYLGPVAQAYRVRAHDIVREAVRLLGVFDDLDSAAQIQGGRYATAPESNTDLVATLDRLADDFRPLSDERQVHLRLVIAPNLPNAALDRLTAERLIGRLIAATIGISTPQEVIGARLEANGEQLCFSIDRPKATALLDAETLLASTQDAQSENRDAPALGLGFSLRLIASLARQSHGMFRIDRQRFTLILPPVQDSAGETKESC